MAGLAAKVQLHEKYAYQDLDVISVNLEGEEGLSAAKTALQEAHVNLTNWCIAEAMDDEVLQVLQMEAIPALNVYDRTGALRKTFLGEVESAELEDLVQTLLAER